MLISLKTKDNFCDYNFRAVENAVQPDTGTATITVTVLTAANNAVNNAVNNPPVFGQSLYKKCLADKSPAGFV